MKCAMSRKVVVLASAILGVFSIATNSQRVVAQTVNQTGPTILQTYKGHFLIGTAGDPPGGFSEQELKLLKDNFNVITPENYLKPAPVHPLEDLWNFPRPDAMVKWAAENGIAIHGHTLMWHSQTANWFFEGNDKELTTKRLKDHITTLVGHYKGKIRSWDVVNEAINDNGNAQTGETENLRNSNWLRIIGPEFLTLAFKFAHEADPDAKLYYNDYGIENGAKHQSSLVLLKRLIKDGAPIHGVGIQGHWNTNSINYAALDQAIANYKALGLKVAITELDITIQGATGGQLGQGAPGGGARRGRGPASGPATGPAGAPAGAPGGFAARGGRGGRGGGAGNAAPVNPASNVLEVVTDLNADQKSKVTPIADDATAKLAAWQQSSQRALAPVQPQYAAGQVAYEHEIMEYNAELTKQNALRDEIINDAEAKLLAILTPAQAEKWQQARLNAAFTTHFAALEVTDAQKAKVDPIIAESAKKLAAAKDKGAIASAKAEFVTKSLGVLDADQAQRYLPPGARGGARGAGVVTVASEAGLKAQADAYARVFTIFVKHKDAMDRVTFWGLNDARSWRAPQPALIFDPNNQRKPAYNAIVDALANPVAPPAPQ